MSKVLFSNSGSEANDTAVKLVWYYNNAIGEWLAELAEKKGLDYLWCKAGPEFNMLMTDKARCKGKILIATSNAHYQGKDLQFDHRQLMVQWPRSASRAEQMIGRQHRHGLEYDDVHVQTINTLEFDDIQFGATLNDAAFLHQSQQGEQKLLYATYKTQPKVIPLEVLMEWGSDTKALGEEGRRVLDKKFGNPRKGQR